MTPTPKIAAGDVLWYGGTTRRGDVAEPTAVQKVGRLWITTEHGRFLRSTMKSESNWIGRLYMSEADQVAARELDAAWTAFDRRARNAWGPPSGLTMETLRQVEALLWPDEREGGAPPSPRHSDGGSEP